MSKKYKRYKSTNVTNVTNMVSINSHNKRVRSKNDHDILHMLLIIAIICCHFTNHRSRQKYCHTINIKMEKNNELKENGTENPRCYYFDNINKM